MANTIEYAKKFVPVIDEIYKAGSLTAGMDAATKLDFTGVNEVKVLKVSTTGLGDYDRETGYPKGDITATWETMKLTKERAKEISIDRMDNEEVLGQVFGQVTGKFMREHVIPELDAYRFAAYASAQGNTTVSGELTTSTVLEAIDAAATVMDGEEIPEEGRRLYINSDIKPLLNRAVSREFGSDGTVSTVLKGYNGMQIIYVPKTRFYTSITLNSGETAWGYQKSAAVYQKTADTSVVSGKTYYTESSGVYTEVASPATASLGNYYELVQAGGKPINFMMIHPQSILQVQKFALPKIFTPDVNQDKDAWKFQFRLYHDALVYENKVKGIYVHSGV